MKDCNITFFVHRRDTEAGEVKIFCVCMCNHFRKRSCRLTNFWKSVPESFLIRALDHFQSRYVTSKWTNVVAEWLPFPISDKQCRFFFRIFL